MLFWHTLKWWARLLNCINIITVRSIGIPAHKYYILRTYPFDAWEQSNNLNVALYLPSRASNHCYFLLWPFQLDKMKLHVGDYSTNEGFYFQEIEHTTQKLWMMKNVKCHITSLIEQIWAKGARPLAEWWIDILERLTYISTLTCK